MRRILTACIMAILFITGCQKNTTSLQNTDQKSEIQPLNTVEDEESQTNYYLIKNMYGVDSNPQPSDFFAENDSLERLKDFNKELHNNFDYIEIYFQPLYVIGKYNNGVNFVYDENPELVNQEVEINKYGNTYVTPIKSVQLDNKINLSSYIDTGKWFSAADYDIADEQQEISIVLGHGYNDIYKLNDIITLNLHEKDVKFKVIGFLNEGSTIREGHINAELDEYIVLPSFSTNYIPETEDESKYQKILYLEKNTGLISNVADYSAIKDEIQNIADKYSLLYTVDENAIELSYNWSCEKYHYNGNYDRQLFGKGVQC